MKRLHVNESIMDDIIKLLQELMSKKPTPKSGIADTAAGIDFIGKRFQKFLGRGIAISEVYPDWLSGKVEKPEGPLEEGIIENFIHVAQRLVGNH